MHTTVEGTYVILVISSLAMAGEKWPKSERPHKKINFLLSINSKWPPRSKSCCLKGLWINVLEALIDQKFIEIDALLMCMCNFNIIVCAYITLFYFAREIFLVCEIL